MTEREIEAVVAALLDRHIDALGPACPESIKLARDLACESLATLLERCYVAAEARLARERARKPSVSTATALEIFQSIQRGDNRR